MNARIAAALYLLSAIAVAPLGAGAAEPAGVKPIGADAKPLNVQPPKPAEPKGAENIPPLDDVKFAGLPAEQAAKEMTLPPGFKATLFAGEPDVVQPIAFCIDDRGRLWVVEGMSYPSHVGRPGATESERQWVDAAVWRYHPTRHRFEVFAEGTSNPWGVDFDEHGQCFIEACVVPHFWHIIQGARYLRQGGEHY